MTYAKKVLSVPLQREVEQALAGERSVGWICDRNVEDDGEHRGNARRAGPE